LSTNSTEKASIDEQAVAGTTDSGSEKTTTKQFATTEVSKNNSLILPGYARILVPHDGSEMSDKALAHGIYLAKTSNAELVILHVLEHVGDAEVTSLDVSTEDSAGKRNGSQVEGKDLKVTLEGQGMRIIEDRIRICKENGVKHVSYKVQVGNPGDEIIKVSQEIDFDLIVMASKRITSRILGSTTRKVIDICKKATLIIPESHKI
jgi:nucleotide-binding universal stress UspA family protein